MSAKRNCLFYEEYRDMGASVDFCIVQGSSWNDTIGCHCDDCRDYIPLDWLRHLCRQVIKEKEKIYDDTNETV